MAQSPTLPNKKARSSGNSAKAAGFPSIVISAPTHLFFTEGTANFTNRWFSVFYASLWVFCKLLFYRTLKRAKKGLM